MDPTYAGHRCGGVRVRSWVGRSALLATAILLAGPVETVAQVADRGILSVEVLDGSDAPLQGVQVRLLRAPGDESGEQRTTSSTGRADFYFLVGGRYVLEVERLGFVPVRVTSVEITPGERQRLRIGLRSTTPPVTERDEYDFSELATRQSMAGTEILHGRLDALPLRSLDAAAVPAVSAAGVPGWALPPRFLHLESDGLPTRGAFLPLDGPARDHFAAFPLVSLARASIHPSGHRFGLPQGPGEVLEVQSLRGSGNATGRISLGGHLTPSSGDTPGGAGGPWFSGILSTPLRGDTIRSTSGLHFERVEEFHPAVLGPESGVRSSLVRIGAADPTAAVPSDPFRARERNVINAFSRLDWNVSSTSALTIQAGALVLPDAEVLPSLPLPEGIAGSTSGSDLVASSRLLSTLEGGHAIELNVGVHRSQRVLGSGLEGGPRAEGEAFANQGTVLGSFRGPGAEISRTRLTLAPAGTYTGETLRLRGGMTLGLGQWSDTRPEQGLERILRGDDSHAGLPGGLGHRVEEAGRDLSLSHQELALFAEQRWRIVPELRLTLGGRIDWERYPWEDLEPDPHWQSATGIVDAVSEGTFQRFSGAAALRWEPTAVRGWAMEVSAGMQPGTHEPGLLGEILDERGQSRMIRSLGQSAEGLSAEGLQLSLLGPEFEPPRGDRWSVRVEGPIAPSVRVGVEAFRERVDFLPRRRDLNRVPGGGVEDQFGRIHYGEILHRDGLISIRPGSDRRFAGFDRVWALESDGWTETSGVLVGTTVEMGGLLVEANYRFSDTRDNAPFGLTGAPVPLDGFWDAELAESDWVEGRSDLDRPHRFALLGILELPIGPEAQLSWSYRMDSGLPFTPGVRDALGSAWEEGWTRLEPIALPGGTVLPSGGGWRCDAAEAAHGRLERNACRGEAIHSLDLRFEIGLPSPGGHALGLRVDALNLLDQVEVLRDPALWVVDGSRPPILGPRTNVTLPVVENPTFGEPIARLARGRSVRLGLEYRF